MPVNLPAPVAADLHPVAGVRIGVTEAGVRKANRKDLTVFLLDEGTTVAGVFTQNRFCAAPVQVGREHLQAGKGIRAMVINTGNANAGTGAAGLANARATCAALGKELGLAPEQILPFSTGVIMEELPVDRIVAGLPQAIAAARADNWATAAEGIMTTDTLPKAIAAAKADNWATAAEGIMTTDTQPKAYSRQLQVGGKTVTVTGISKGAGMIRPNMATMLGFVATDAAIDPALLQGLVKELADGSFNRVTIDGDTSTNDSFVLMATHQAGHAPIASWDGVEAQALKAALLDVARLLAQAIVRDGEGATKFITVQIDGGKTEEECRLAAYAIAHSPLVKTAFFASDPNLGRILAAVGYAGIDDLDQGGIDLYLDDVHVAKQGVMKQQEITVRVVLGRGNASQTVWTCDFSHEYVTINADYRS